MTERQRDDTGATPEREDPVAPDSFADKDPYEGSDADRIPWIDHARAAYEEARQQRNASAPTALPEASESPAEALHSDAWLSDAEAPTGERFAGVAPDNDPVERLRWRDRARLWWAKTLAKRRDKLERRDLGNVDAQRFERHRQQQRLMAGALGCVGLLAAALWAGSQVNRGRVVEPEVRLYTNDFKLGPDTLEKQSYQRRYDERLEAMGRRLAGLEETLGALDTRLKEAARKEGGAALALGTESAGSRQPGATPLPDFASDRLPGIELPTPPTRPAHEPPRLSKLAVADAADRETQKGPGRSRALWDEPMARNRARHEAEKTYLPAGTFVRGVVLSGVTAPTGGNAAQNPIPMLIELTDLARLPNRFRSDIERCFVTANATGDLSSERVWVRLDRLSCMSKKGKAIDVRVQGYATGEDGKTGVRARLVTRSGQAIANALFLGSLSGLGKAVSLSAQSTTSFDSGAVQTTVDDPWRAGMGKGMSDAMDRIVAYYIRLADKIFPVLELDSGRRLDIVLSQGVTVAEDASALAPAAIEDEEINGAARFGRAVRSQE